MNSKPKILVVDDDPENLSVLVETLKDEYAIIPAINGRKALDRAAKAPQPDLILLDVMMPDLNGYEVCAQLKRDPITHDIPVIFVTALSEVGNETRGFSLGAVDYITKPINPPVVRTRIKSHLTMGALHRQLQEQNHLLQASLQLRKDLANMIVHDLRNPLGSITLGCSLLAMTKLDDRQHRLIDRISSETKNLESLIDNLLLTAKLEAGKLLLHCQPTYLNDLIRDVSDRFQLLAEQRHIYLDTQLLTGPQALWLDQNLIRRVIENLLSNAMKFAPQGSTIHLKTLHPEQQSYQLQITDSGPGIPDDKKQIIFEKYETVQVMEKVPQIGLGLAFCKMVIESHAGQIEVTDNQPKGSIFTVTLPVTLANSVTF